MIRAIDGAQVELYYGGSKKLETTSTGVTVTGQATVSNGLEVTGGNANFADNGRARFGASADLQIYHDGSNSFIDEAGTGDLYIRSSDNMYFQTYGSGKKWITLTEDAGVELFHNDSKKLETTSAGATVTGSLTVDDSIIHTGDTDTKIEFGDDSIDVTSGGTTAFDVVGGYTRFATSTRFVANATFDDNSKARFGTHNDLEIYHNGSNSFIDDNGAGSLFIRGDATIEIKSLAQDEHYIKCVENDTVELYHNGSKKFETTSTGTKTTGQINLAALNSAPSSASDTGTVGEIRFTSDYIYVCVASNTWKRAALSTW